MTVLPPVTVIGTLENPATGKSVIPREVIRDLPRGNGSINELLRVLPDVQLSEDFGTSRTAGEILPPNVSISGGKVFQNNFIIDGIGNNSLLDPAAKTLDFVSDVPGHPQETFLDADLIEEIIVYDSNIPAEYGGFTGGVVEVKTRMPAESFGGKLSYRTTSDKWTRFHLGEQQRLELERSNNDAVQPQFEKHQPAVYLDLPLGPGLGLLGAYSRLTSKIPHAHLGGSKSQHRRVENFFVKGSAELSAEDLFEISFSYTPSKAEMFFPDVENSDFDIEMGGATLNAGYRHFFSLGEIQLDSAYRQSENSRDGPRHWRSWAVTPDKDWGAISGSAISAEGGFGSVEKTQQAFNLKGVLWFDELPLASAGHEIKAGLEYEGVRGTFDRNETTLVFKGARISPDIVCAEDTFGCAEGEQFFTLRNVYDPASVEATIESYHLFAQDQIRFRRLTLRPGVRASYNDFMENLDLAPRLTATYDVFANRRTLLIGGANRYYGKNLLTYKLREAKQPFRSESRTSFQNQLTDWTPAAFRGRNITRFSRLDTPYSDELALGLDQALLGGRLSLKYVHREGRDEFARSYGDVQPDGLRYYTLDNHGSSSHDSYRLSWERGWPRHFVSLNATWQETTSSNADYDTTLEAEELEDRIWYQGQMILKTDLPRNDYNRPWVLNLTYVGRLPLGVTFTNIAQYRSGYRDIEGTGVQQEIPGGQRRIDPLTGEEIFETLEVYETVNFSDAVVFDWRLSWQKDLWPEQQLVVNLEINNVFDKKVRAGGSSDNFLLGRQFWAGMEYRF